MLKPVEWVLVVFYGPEAHRATYGRRVESTKYTKDFIQLSRTTAFTDELRAVFPDLNNGTGTVALTLTWPGGSARGSIVLNSADRPHLKWGTADGAPAAWKMTPHPSPAGPGTLPGDPTHQEETLAEAERAALVAKGAGQPYLVAIKLLGERDTLHLRVYLADPGPALTWASISVAPPLIQELASRTRQTAALAAARLDSGGEAPSQGVERALDLVLADRDPGAAIESMTRADAKALEAYIANPGRGLFFDSSRNHEAWAMPAPLPTLIESSAGALVRRIHELWPELLDGDALAEGLPIDPAQVAAFDQQIAEANYAVADTHANVKTRGSAQTSFARMVKENYGNRCAVTGIELSEFLVASHIVPWSVDESIRLDPANGICLSLLIDRAFEVGCVVIDDDLTLRVDWERVDGDAVLQGYLRPFDGKVLANPSRSAPKVEYLRRRRDLVA